MPSSGKWRRVDVANVDRWQSAMLNINLSLRVIQKFQNSFLFTASFTINVS
jgi:hypothetical protein